jgi:hypothetical protein
MPTCSDTQFHDLASAKARLAMLQLVDDDNVTPVDAYVFEEDHCVDFLTLLMYGGYHLDHDKTYIRVVKDELSGIDAVQWRTR